jgi:hypothetical protein
MKEARYLEITITGNFMIAHALNLKVLFSINCELIWLFNYSYKWCIYRDYVKSRVSEI